MKLKIIIPVLLTILIISCVPKVQVETPQPQETEQPIQVQEKPQEVKTEVKPTTQPYVNQFNQPPPPISEKEYYLIGRIIEERNGRYKIRIQGSTRVLEFTDFSSPFNPGDTVSFIETGAGDVKGVMLYNPKQEEGSDDTQLVFYVGQATPGSSIYESRGVMIDAAPTRYTIRDDNTFIRHTFHVDNQISLRWGDKVSYRIDQQGNIISVRILEKYLPD